MLLVLGRVWHFLHHLGGGFKHVLFSPLLGEDFLFDSCFSDGLKPPTSHWSLIISLYIFISSPNKARPSNSPHGIPSHLIQPWYRWYHQGDPETLGFTTVDFLSLTPGKWHLLKELTMLMLMETVMFPSPPYFLGGKPPGDRKFTSWDGLFIWVISGICTEIWCQKNEIDGSEIWRLRGINMLWGSTMLVDQIGIVNLSHSRLKGMEWKGRYFPTFSQSCLGYK